MSKLLLIDGHNLLFKMFYGMPFQFYSDNGLNITGTVGFVGAILKLAKQFNPDACLVVFDGENSLVRGSIDEQYKANRTIDYSVLPDEENPFSQLDYIKKTLEFLSIKWVETVDCEADDYIACITKSYDGEVYIVSTDQDFLQLINDKVFVINYRGAKSKIVDNGVVLQKYGVEPNEFLMIKALMGDKSDNVVGICGVGLKTAVKILKSVKAGESNKFSKIYYDNYLLIKKNMELMTLPYRNASIETIDYNNCKLKASQLVSIKVVSWINEALK